MRGVTHCWHDTAPSRVTAFTLLDAEPPVRVCGSGACSNKRPTVASASLLPGTRQG
jgi:hypothetical protein